MGEIIFCAVIAGIVFLIYQRNRTSAQEIDQVAGIFNRFFKK